MKKTYQTPLVSVIEIYVESRLLTGSVDADPNKVISGSTNFSREQKQSGIGGGLWSDMQ